MKLLFLLAVLLQDNEEHAKLVSAKADREKIVSGGRITLTFEVAVDPEWHTYPTYRQKFTQETWFKFDSEDVFIAGEIKNPKTTRHEEKLGDGSVLAYDQIEGTATWEVPVRVHAKAGAHVIKGAVKGQTCKGVCHEMELPFEIPITVDADTTPRVTIASVKPAKKEAKNGEPVAVELALEIPKGWYIYPFNKTRGVGKSTVVEAFPGEVRGVATEPKPKPHDDKDPDLAYDYHEGTFTVSVPLALRNTDVKTVTMRGSLVYQICGGPNQICVDGSTPFSFTIKSLGGDDLPPWTPGAKPEDGTPAAPTGGKPDSADFLGWVLLAIGGGLVSLIQPCVFPLLPITMTYFLKQGDGSRGKGLVLGGLYGLGIVLTFTLIGVIFTVSLGADGPRIFAANPWVNIVVAGLFFWFAFSLFGLYEIALPSFVTGSLTSGGPKKGYSGAFILGLLFAVVTFTCTIPIAAAILTLTATAGSRGTGFLAMFVYSVTMAAPFVLMGVFPSLIKAFQRGGGGWLHMVKVTMGFIELALALFYLSKADLVWQFDLLRRPVMIAIWAGVMGATSLYLLGVFRMKGDEPPPPSPDGSPGLPQVGVARMVVALAFGICAVYLASGFTGRPLGVFDAVLPPKLAGDFVEPKGRGEPGEKVFDEFGGALAEAKKSGRPVFVEFTGVT